MNAAEYIVQVLKSEGIDTVFGYQGGNITYLVDAISREENIKYVQTYHEQGAAFAANSYAQVSQKFGVAAASSGPGAINMINGIANAYYDSVPCLFLTGNINTAVMRESNQIRQNGFQETDIVGMVKGITKYARTVYKPEQLPQMLRQALCCMQKERPGPVLLDIPHNIQRMELKESIKQVRLKKSHLAVTVDAAFETVNKELKAARHPVLLLGNGSRGRRERILLKELLGRFPMPTVVSLCGKDAVPNNHPCYRGMIGSYALPYSNLILQKADFVLALGTRMDERQRAVDADKFLQKAYVVHVDIDQNELGHVKKDAFCLHMSVEQFLTGFLDNAEEGTEDLHRAWVEETGRWMRTPEAGGESIYGHAFKKKLTEILGEVVSDCVVCVDVGNHQMAAAQILNIGEGSWYLNSAGHGCMGYALPAAIGAYYAAPDKEVIMIAGDGGFMMNLQELQLIKREKIPITIVVVNNRGLGMIENYQKLAMDGRLYGSRWGYEAADFCKVAKAFGLDYCSYCGTKDGALLKDSSQILVEIEV